MKPYKTNNEMQAVPHAQLKLTIANVPCLILIFFVFLTSCYGPRKVNKWMEDKYGNTVTAQSKNRDDYFSVSSSLLTNEQFVSTTTKQTKHLLPLIFYWQADYVNTCNLNPRIPVNTFTSSFRSYAGAHGLKQKLGGAKIELSVEAIPNVFAINDRGRVVWVVYAIGWDVFSIIPENKNMVVSYRVTKDQIEIKKGTVIIPDINTALERQTKVKEGTLQYLMQYDENIKTMTKKAVDELLNEL